MKNIFFLVFSCLFVLSCSNSQSGGSGKKEESNISKRLVNITPANSYSTLLVDSLVMEKFITDKKIPDSLSRRIRSFYTTRNYQFAWFSSDGLTEQARGFWNLHDYVTTYSTDSSLKDKALQKRMDRLIAEDDLSVNAKDKSFINTELTLTQHFIHYMLNNYEKGYVKRKEMRSEERRVGKECRYRRSRYHRTR